THNTFALNASVNDAWLEPFVRASAIAFFDAYLRNMAAAKTWLASNSMNTWSRGVAKITTK
ncbi:MAG: hypothetical protein AAB354_08335, partial [candidate division KSB1 bacterium]